MQCTHVQPTEVVCRNNDSFKAHLSSRDCGACNGNSQGWYVDTCEVTQQLAVKPVNECIAYGGRASHDLPLPEWHCYGNNVCVQGRVKDTEVHVGMSDTNRLG